MKKVVITISTLVGLAFGNVACAGLAFPGTNQGFVYADSLRNEKVNVNDMGTKKGEACAASILGWFTTGDSSVEAAAKAGGVTKIASVDNSIKNYLGVYAQYCVIVTGN